MNRTAAACAVLAGASVSAAGPDITVSTLSDTWRWGAQSGVTAYTIGTVACNLGDAPAPWDSTIGQQHPIIALNMYRLRSGRFEQIGISWCKHGFASENNSAIICGTCSNTTPDFALNPGCSDPYDAALNASQTLLGPRSEVNAFTGVFPFPFTIGWQQSGGPLNKRIQVLNSDLDPAQNVGALYFADAMYLTPYEVGAARMNNTAWRQFARSFDAGGGSWAIDLVGDDVRGEPGIRAWKANDPEVIERVVDVPGDGRMMVAYRVFHEGDLYRYEYAVYNMNCHRSVGSFQVPFDDAADATTAFKDISYHSGEVISGTDWTWTRGTGGAGVVWATQTFGANANANAIRWHTLYNFTLISHRPPADVQAVLELWRPGSPASVNATVAAPSPPPHCGGDANHDNRCDGNDLSVLLSSFGHSQGEPGYAAGADFNGDSTVNTFDLSILLSNFGCPFN